MDEHSLWWTAGMLDGDGSINGSPNGGVSTSVGKALKGMPALEKLLELHGGRVSRNAVAHGTTQEIHSWVKAGPEFCQLIAPYVQLKKPQFELASTYPTINTNGKPFFIVQGETRLLFMNRKDAADHFEMKEQKIKNWILKNVYPTPLRPGWTIEFVDIATIRERRVFIRNELKRLKTIEHAPITEDIPHSYFAGMFDAEGCIGVCGYNQIRISLCQKYRAICDALKKKHSGVVSMNKTTQMCSWRISQQALVQSFLRSILPYSVEKVEQIRLALAMPVNGAQVLKAQLKALKGNQGTAGVPETNAPQKCLHGLPRYICHAKDSKGVVVGYIVQKKKINKKFVKNSLTMEEKLKEALAYREEMLKSSDNA
jgi:hypothetical protein